MINDIITGLAQRVPRFQWRLFLAAALLVKSFNAVGAVEVQAEKNRGSESENAAVASLQPQCGIQVSGLFLSAGGNMVDFRYRVLDPVKAAALTKVDAKPALLDHTTGAKLLVPSTPKTGPLRQTVKTPVAGKIYFMLFANTRHHVKSGDKVTITVGDVKIENLIVE